MRLPDSVWLLCVGLAVACGPSADEAAEVPGPSPRGRVASGEVRGTVLDAETESPVEGAWISAGEMGAGTDAEGAYTLRFLPPGPTKLRAYRRGFRAESFTVIVRPGDATVADVSLPPAASPCCRLTGRWAVSFALDSAGLNSRPSARDLSGSVEFSSADTTMAGESAGIRSATAAGRAAFDFTPLLGTGLDARVEELEGIVFAGDSVAITLIPRFGDWAIELLGRQEADTVRGDWFQRASCCGAYGTFVMKRSVPPR